MPISTSNLLVYLLENAEKIKELSNIFIGAFMSLGLLILLGVVVYFGFKVVKDFRTSLQQAVADSAAVNKQALDGVIGAVTELRETMISFRSEISHSNTIVVQTREAIITHHADHQGHNERSHSIKEIATSTYETAQELLREAAKTKDTDEIKSAVHAVANHLASIPVIRPKI